MGIRSINESVEPEAQLQTNLQIYIVIRHISYHLSLYLKIKKMDTTKYINHTLNVNYKIGLHDMVKKSDVIFLMDIKIAI